MMSADGEVTRLRGYWDKQSGGYDREMGFWERRLFGQHRGWVTARATGDVLEVAVGTGLNLPSYPDDVRLTGVDFSPGMLAIARHRAGELGRTVDLREGDAHALDFPDASFDTVVCTFGLCAIPDERRAVAEMTRVLRPGGRLLLLDHVASSAPPVRALQWLIERISIPVGGEHFRRRPLNQVRALGLDVVERQRFRLGLVERLAARKPLVAGADDAPRG